MTIRSSKKNIENIYIIAIASITVVFNPINSYEAFNAPKFSMLTIFATMLIVLSSKVFPIRNIYKVSKLLSISLMLIFTTSIFSLLVAPTSIYQQLFGIDGRNTGFITILSLLIMFYVAVLVTGESYLDKITKVLFGVGCLSIVYGLIQSFGLDPINWNNQFNASIGFFGNPNFQSSMLGMFSAVIWAYLFGFKTSKLRILTILLLFLTLFAILRTDSQQGVILFGASFIIIFFFWIFNNHKIKLYIYGYSIFIVSCAMVFLIDVFGKSPWKSIFYQNSISERGDLWRAALEISKDYPISGVGFDGFEYYFRTYRDLTASNRQGVGTSSNSAHNIYLDFLVNGGYLHLISYLLINILVVISIVSITKQQTYFEPKIIAVIGAWIAYQLQSLISVNNIGLSIWGWTLSGVIVGYSLKLNAKYETLFLDNWKFRNVKFRSTISLVAITGATYLSSSPLRADINFRSALESREINRVLDTAYEWPQTPQRMFQVSTILKKNSLFDLANQVSKDAVSLFPNSFENLEQYYSLPNLTEQEKNEIFSKMREIDPLNPLYR
jgi:O-antigen ligase